MKLPHSSRIVAACIALLSMLFMQLAVAGYACPELKIDLVSKSVALSTDATDAGSMPGCAGMDTELPSLCHAHAQIGKQSLDKPALPDVQPFIAVTLPLAFDASPPAYSLIAVRPNSLFLTRIIAPPLSIRNCCFRI